MPSNWPVVSIVMATYNFERFLPRAIESALAQNYPADALDIVVIDDGSTDRTPEVVQPYLEQIRYFRKENGGLLSTVNRGLGEARGEFISLLSGDDEFMPDKTRAQVEFLLERPEVGMVYADLELVDDDGAQMHRSLWQTANLRQVRGRCFGDLLTKNVISGGSMMFRSSLKPHFHPLPDDAAWEDWYISLRIAAVAEIDYIPRALYRYRYHGENMNLGARGDKLASLLRTELAFRRSLLSGLRSDGLATVPELIGGWAALNGTVKKLVQMTGATIEDLIPVTDEQRARSRELAVRGADPFELVAALALDPWNTDAQGLLELVLTPAPALDGVRSFAVLAYADELTVAPEMLSAYGSVFSNADDVTLIVAGERFDALAEALADSGLAGEDGPDLLAVEDSPSALAGAVGAVYSRVPQQGALALVPRVDEQRAAVLADLADAARQALTTT